MNYGQLQWISRYGHNYKLKTEQIHKVLSVNFDLNCVIKSIPSLSVVTVPIDICI
jgi:hypothetical protein